MLQALSDRPEAAKFAAFLDGLLAQRSAELEFIILFGSMARGDWSCGSDYDVLIGLGGEDGKRLLDRMAEFAPSSGVAIDVFPYSRSEWQRMFQEYHPLLLEALEHGMILWDRGAFADMHATFQQWRQCGQVQPWRSGWKITAPAPD
ncbi:MAG TPA: nucleotidyltransferase domain-containing protein [Candidatus Tectomicrobia bacterium]